MNNTNIPPKKIRNNTYANQNLWDNIPLTIHIIIVWINNIKPIARGWFICVNIILVVNMMIKILLISENSLFKILVLGINEEIYFLFSEVLKGVPYIWFTRPIFLLNY